MTRCYYYDLFKLMYIVPMVKITKIVFLLFLLLLSLGKPPHGVSGGVTQGRRKGSLSLGAAETVHHSSDVLRVCHSKMLLSLHFHEPGDQSKSPLFIVRDNLYWKSHSDPC